MEALLNASFPSRAGASAPKKILAVMNIEHLSNSRLQSVFQQVPQRSQKLWQGGSSDDAAEAARRHASEHGVEVHWYGPRPCCVLRGAHWALRQRWLVRQEGKAPYRAGLLD